MVKGLNQQGKIVACKDKQTVTCQRWSALNTGPAFKQKRSECGRLNMTLCLKGLCFCSVLLPAACALGSRDSRPVPPAAWTYSVLRITTRLRLQPKLRLQPRQPPPTPLQTPPQANHLMVRVKTRPGDRNPRVCVAFSGT